jgi:hypothetical protein
MKYQEVATKLHKLGCQEIPHLSEFKVVSTRWRNANPDCRQT